VAVFTGAAGGKTFQTAAFEWSSIVRRTLRSAALPGFTTRGFTERIFSRKREERREREREREREGEGRERERERELARLFLLFFLRFIFIGKFVVNLSGTIYRGGTLRANESDLVKKKK